MIGQKGIPTKSGGIERHVESLAIQLAKSGNEVIVYTRPRYSDRESKEYKGVRLISLPSVYSKHLDAASHTLLATFHAIFKIRDLDIIHYHGIGPSLFLIIARILKPKTKIVSTFHCQDYYHQKWSFFARTMLKLGELSSVYLPHRTIVVSKNLKQYVKRKYNRDVIYIPNGVSTILQERNKASIKTEKESLRWWDLKPRGYILTVNRLVRHKGIHTLIESYKKLDESIQKDKKLVIVGDTAFTDNYLDELRKMAGNNPNIIFTGQQTGRSLRMLFQNAFLFVHPSESEGLSLSLLESLAYGLPVLASNISANIEVLGNDGFSFKSKNSKDLYEKLSLVLSLPSSRLMKKATSGRKKIAKNYNWQLISENTERLYEEALSLDKPRIFFGLHVKKA